MFKKLAESLKTENRRNACPLMSSPIEPVQERAQKTFLKSLSKHALNLYERKTDINNFTRLALSNPENTSHNDIIDELFDKDGLVNPLDEDSVFELSENERFLKDLGL